MKQDKPVSTSSTSKPPEPAKPKPFDALTASPAEYEAEKRRRFGVRGDYIPRPTKGI